MKKISTLFYTFSNISSKTESLDDLQDLLDLKNGKYADMHKLLSKVKVSPSQKSMQKIFDYIEETK